MDLAVRSSSWRICIISVRVRLIHRSVWRAAIPAEWQWGSDKEPQLDVTERDEWGQRGRDQTPSAHLLAPVQHFHWSSSRRTEHKDTDRRRSKGNIRGLFCYTDTLMKQRGKIRKSHSFLEALWPVACYVFYNWLSNVSCMTQKSILS